MSNLAIGTIISSVLNFDQLCKVLGETPAFNSKTSSYAPCDGRSVAGSKLELATGREIALSPDLRGRFIRGLNQIYSVDAPIFDIHKADEDGAGRKPGDYQPDAVARHTHSYTDRQEGLGPNQADDGNDIGFNRVDTKTTGENTDACNETRPRNVSTFFYIKIN